MLSIYECVCNQAACPPSIECEWMTLDVTLPSPIATGSHEDVCCASYECTCVHIACIPPPSQCPQYYYVDEVDNTTNPCCPIYTCECNTSLCEEPPVCTSPQYLNTSTSENSCCSIYNCACPQSNNSLTCVLPKVGAYTETACPTKYCRCPDDCPVDPINNCTEKPGCRPVADFRDDCGCCCEC